MARILLIRPPIDDQPGQLVLRRIPLGPLALAAWLRDKRGDEVVIQDYHLKPKRMRNLDAHLRELKPDVVGFSAYSVSGPYVHRMAARVKAWRPDCRVVVGGPYAKGSPLHILADANVDYVLIGDGEFAFSALLDSLERGEVPAGIPGVAGRNGNAEPAWDGRL